MLLPGPLELIMIGVILTPMAIVFCVAGAAFRPLDYQTSRRLPALTTKRYV